MEGTSKRSGFGVVIKEEKRVEPNSDQEGCRHAGKVGKAQVQEDGSLKPSSPNPEDLGIRKQVPIATSVESPSMETHSRASSSNNQKDKEDPLESAKAEMGEVREENERLKMILARIVKDYQSLQTHYDIVQQEAAKKSTETVLMAQAEEEPEFVSLSLGRVSTEAKRDEKTRSTSKTKEDEKFKEGLGLGLDCKLEMSNIGLAEPISNPCPENTFEESKEEETTETWPPSKIPKTTPNGNDEASPQAQVKKARVSVRARCETPTMNDGCQWRKYGQKIAKGNPCPRAYYRCTVAPACPVRKQVQRCAEDMSILITTYEGTHNHPLPMSATAMASTTSAAACMLMSGSSTSQPGLGASATTTTAADLHGLNFNLSDSSRSRQFYLSNSSISSTPSYPTITLDLTAPPAASHFNRLSSNFHSTPRYSSSSFNFSSSESNSLPSSSSWGNGYLNYGIQSYNKTPVGTLNLGRQTQEHVYQPYMQNSTNPAPPQQALTDTIAAATKAITSDPSFRSALAAAITSIVSGGGVPGNQGGRDNGGQNLKWGETFAAISPYASTKNGNGCASSYLNRSSSSNAQPGNLMFLPPSLPFSTSKSASASPTDNREHILN